MRPVLLFVFFSLLLFTPSLTAPTHTCIHDEVFDVKTMRTVPQKYNKRGTMSPIRLLVDTSYLDNDSLGRTCTSAGQTVTTLSPVDNSNEQYTCTSADVLTLSLRSYIESLLSEAVDLWQGTLLVNPVAGLLQFTANSQPEGVYGGVYVTGSYVNPGVAADMVIFVTARPILSSGSGYTSTLAVASPVIQDQDTGRPIMGHLNINPSGVDTSSAYFNQNFGVVVHEMTHALGFTYDLYSFLTTSVSLPVAAGDDYSERIIVNSPTVVAWARAYYGCDSIQGVELENQGGSGTQNSHWEKRVAMNEYMTGTASRNPVFSDLTMALLKDTGWYDTNLSLTGQLLWGQGQGCDFALRSCPNWPSGYQGYFCTTNNQAGCTADYQAKGVCQISEATGVPSMYQYFSDPGEIGSYDLPDYCPVYWGYDNGWCFDTTQTTSNIVNQGETFGADSKCYTSSLLKDLPVGGTTTQVCYTSACTAPTELRVKVGSYWYLCPPGSSIEVIGYGGTLDCPSKITQICADSPNDDTWPVFSAISPNSGGPGLKVTIYGRNFLDGLKVTIADDLIDLVVHNTTTITATIPDSEKYKNPANLIDQDKSVIITDTKDRTAVGYNAFTIKIALNWQFIKNALDYLGSNWLITAGLIAGIGIALLCCCYCIYRQKGDAEEADTEEYYD